MERFLKSVENFTDKFGLFIIGGLIGAIVHRARNTMDIKKFLAVLLISAFIGVIVGILSRNYLNANEEVTFVIVSLSGVFSKDLLDEIQTLIKYISIVAKKLFEKKLK